MHDELSDHRIGVALAVAKAEGYDRLQEALQRIVQWADAYPLDVFPEPDLKKAAAVLKEAGIELGAISASNMRHVIKGVGEIARAALQSPGDT